ncbi:hypothetical protein [Psychroserpens ponticola]|uniref:Uncharacterized protein n=1 Tax=Psychroserpens ponticola TaxID=2932268 RepID=A0ABY7RTS4_9FLAO|nr:hypothetical protein [Psychroserpens ponticola]WCO00363.1 hypothetical protein MUN68_009790 [Psychroserpens ponticola]
MTERFDIILKDVTALLVNELSEHLTYHSVNHILYVFKKAEHIALNEKASQKNVFFVEIAALYPDLRFMNIREGHEAESCKITKLQLVDYNFLKEDIDVICEAIMVTKVPQNPTSHLGEIL